MLPKVQLALLLSLLGFLIWLIHSGIRLRRRMRKLEEDAMARVDERGLGIWKGVAAAVNARLAEQGERVRAFGKFEAFFEMAAEPMVFADEHGRFERVNPAFVSMLGYARREDLEGRPFLDWVHPDDHEATEQAAAKLAAGDEIADFENRYRARDGGWKWVAWRSRWDPVSRRIYAAAREITGEKLAAKQRVENQRKLARLNEDLEQRVKEQTQSLRESEALLRMLVNGIRDYAVVLLDQEGRVQSWNEGATRTKRFQAEEILGESHAMLYVPEDREAGLPARDLQFARENGRFESTGWRFRGDGTRYRANVIINALYDDQGRLQGFAKITRDVTQEYAAADALHREKSLLSTLMENLAEAVVACDAEENLTFFNRRAREWHGQDVVKTPSAEWPTAFDLYAADGETPLAEAHIPLLRAARGESVREFEMVIKTAHRPPRFVVASGDPMIDAMGNKTGAVVVMHDITERRESERVAQRTQRLESIGMLVGGIAHDLNNALSPMLMGIELLKRRYPESSGTIDAMEVSSRHGAAMVKQLLTFARGTGGDRVAVNLRHVVRDVESLIESTFPKNVRWDAECPGSLPAIVGDPTQLHQVLLNLCVNARDAMADGGEIRVAARSLTLTSETMPASVDLEPGEYIEMTVADTGAGIPAEILEQVFDPFFTTKGKDRGTGLGLATAKGIVESHDGAMRVESVEGKGTTFFIFLPVPAEIAGGDQKGDDNDGRDLNGEGRVILLVDDQASIREVGRNVLSALGFHVLTAEDGGAAFTLLQERSEEIDVVVVDRDMPVMDGPTLIRHARSLPQPIPFVLCSGQMGREDADMMKGLHVASILEKPFSEAKLIRAVRHALSGSHHVSYSGSPWG